MLQRHYWVALVDRRAPPLLHMSENEKRRRQRRVREERLAFKGPKFKQSKLLSAREAGG